MLSLDCVEPNFEKTSTGDERQVQVQRVLRMEMR
jgi:hypothetical protein